MIFAAIIVLIGVIGVSVFLLRRGNGKQKDNSKDIGTSLGIISYNYLTESYSDKGIISVGDDGLMHFTDAVSKETTVICDKANCEHEPYDESANPDPICNGYTLGVPVPVSSILMVVDSIYFWGTHADDKGEMQDLEIYRADLNGDNKKKIATVPHSTEYQCLSAASDGRYLVIGYTVDYERKESGELVELDRSEGGIIILDLRDNSIIDNKIDNMRLPSRISFTDRRIYIGGLYLDSVYSKSALTSLSDEELWQYFDQHEYNGMYIYNLESQKGEEHKLLDDTGNQRIGISSDLLINEDMAVFTDGADTILYHEGSHSYETIYSDTEGFRDGKMYKPICWKGFEIYLNKYDGDDTGKSDWIIYDIKDGSKREMGSTNNKIVCYGLGDYLFGMDWDPDAETGSSFVLTEEEFFGTGTGSNVTAEQ